MLLITHDDEDVASLADEVIHLRSGRTMPQPPGYETALA